MKQNKTKLIALMTAVIVISSSFSSAQAEFVLGLAGSFSSSDDTLTQSGGTSNNLTGGSGNALGLFGQYRQPAANNLFLGVHLGYTADSTAWKRSGDESICPIEFCTVPDQRLTNIFNNKYEADGVYDVLGLVGYHGQKVNPFVMFGFSNMRVKAAYSGTTTPTSGTNAGTSTRYNVKETATLTGWKLATGVEYPFSDKLVGHVLLHYADYGKATFTPAVAGLDKRAFGVKQTGIRFGIGYQF